MPPRLRVRSTIKNPNKKRPSVEKGVVKIQSKKPKPVNLVKKRDLPIYSDDSDFVKSDDDSASSVQLSSESEEETEEPKETQPPSSINLLMRSERIMTNQSKLIDALNKIIELKDVLLKQKDEEIDRLQRMVRGLDIQ